jgi:hypothetical protein
MDIVEFGALLFVGIFAVFAGAVAFYAKDTRYQNYRSRLIFLGFVGVFIIGWALWSFFS